MKKEFPKVQVESRAELRQWLAEHHETSDTVWLVTFKKQVPEKYLAYDDIVEEVICFGWIDSLPRKLDAERSMLMLSPRRKGSPWSRVNKNRVEKLLAAGLIMPAGQAKIDQAQVDGTWTIYDEVEDLIIPEDLEAAFAANETAKTNFDNFSPSSRKGILWWIKSAKRAPTRAKRIAETVELAAKNVKANHPR
ncbi:MAG: YdeI/OmpD-associated family protein [Chloroflexota bacterium]